MVGPSSYADHYHHPAAPYNRYQPYAGANSSAITHTPTHSSTSTDSTHSLSSPSTSTTSSNSSVHDGDQQALQLPPTANHHITYNYKSNTYEYTNAGTSYSSDEEDNEEEAVEQDDEEYNGSEGNTPRAKKRKLAASTASKSSSSSSKRTVKPKKHRGVMNQAVIDVGYVLNNQERIFYIYSPWFDQTVEVYTAVGDHKRRILFRASVLADKFKCATNKVGMYLQRRRHNSEGLYQATGFRSKPHGRTGLKSGGYFLSMEVCIGFEKHWHKQAARVEANASAAHNISISVDGSEGRKSGSNKSSTNASPRSTPRSVRTKLEHPAPVTTQNTPAVQYERLVQQQQPTVAEHLSQSLPARSRTVYGLPPQQASLKRKANNLHAMLPQLSPVQNSVQVDTSSVPSLESSYDYSFQPYGAPVEPNSGFQEPATPAPVAPKLPPQFDQPIYQQLLHTQFQQYPEDKPPAARVRIVTPTPLHATNHTGSNPLFQRYLTSSPVPVPSDLMLKRSNTPLRPLLPPSTTNSPSMLFSSSLSIPSMPRITPSPLTIPTHNDNFHHHNAGIHSMSAYNDHHIAGPVRHVRTLKRSMPSLVANVDAPSNARYYTPGSQKLFQQQLYHAMQPVAAPQSSTTYNDNFYQNHDDGFNTYDDAADLSNMASAYSSVSAPAADKKQQPGDIKASELRMLNDLLTSQSTFQYGLTVEQVNTLRMLNGAM